MRPRLDIYQISDPLTGEDAARLIRYINDPQLDAEHDEHIDRADKVFRDLVKSE